MTANAFKAITRDFMRLHKAFFVLIFVVSTIIFLEEFRNGAFNIVLLVVTLFWCLATLASLLDSNFFLLKIYECENKNSSQIFRMLVIDYIALAISLALTEGAFGVYPYALAFLLLYTVVMSRSIHAIVSFAMFFTCSLYSLFVRMIGLSYFYSPEVYGRISEEIGFLKKGVVLSAAYPFLQIMLLLGVMTAAYRIRLEIHRSFQESTR